MISARAKAALAAAKRRGVKLGGDRGRLTAKARLGGNAAQRAKAQARAAWGTPATVAAKNASGTIPIVMTSTADPFAVVGHIARPGGNVTGMASLLVDLTSKRLALLTEIVPGLARVGILSNPDNPNYARTRKNYETAAQSLGMQLVLFDARTPEDIAAAFVAAGRQRPDALSAATETVTQANRSLIAGLATEHRLPAVYGSREFVDAGGLIAYGVSCPDLYRRAAIFVDKIFKGAKPADLPVEQPTRFELIVNLKAARGIGLSIPETFLARADLTLLAGAAAAWPLAACAQQGERIRRNGVLPCPHTDIRKFRPACRATGIDWSIGRNHPV